MSTKLPEKRRCSGCCCAHTHLPVPTRSRHIKSRILVLSDTPQLCAGRSDETRNRIIDHAVREKHVRGQVQRERLVRVCWGGVADTHQTVRVGAHRDNATVAKYHEHLARRAPVADNLCDARIYSELRIPVSTITITTLLTAHSKRALRACRPLHTRGANWTGCRARITLRRHSTTHTHTGGPFRMPVAPIFAPGGPCKPGAPGLPFAPGTPFVPGLPANVEASPFGPTGLCVTARSIQIPCGTGRPSSGAGITVAAIGTRETRLRISFILHSRGNTDHKQYRMPSQKKGACDIKGACEIPAQRRCSADRSSPGRPWRQDSPGWS